MPDRRVTDRHRLTIQPDLLSQSSRDSRSRIGEIDALGPDSTSAAVQSPEAIPQLESGPAQRCFLSKKRSFVQKKLARFDAERFSQRLGFATPESAASHVVSG
jgi:hypothetical protein